jgi:lipopolysaccharide biosynthesis glycosyltransferase
MSSGTITSPLHVVTAANERYLSYLACCLASLGERGSASGRMQLTVIHRGIGEDVRLKMDALVPAPHAVQWVEPSTQALRKFKAPLDFAELSPHYFRLLMPFVLPDVTRAVYLDADTVVLEDIYPLWTIDLEGFALAAVRDYLPCISDAVENWAELQLKPNAPYFNSGVLVVDLDQWREQRIAERVLSVCRENQEHLCAQRKWPQHDQYGLNVVLHGQWKPLHQIWNYGADLQQSDARIVHYVGNGKVDLPTCQPAFKRLFFDMLSRTPFRLPRKCNDLVAR